jgi:L-ascorbate metabolism protein UlaG (beta-lactamase superfamily)
MNNFTFDMESTAAATAAARGLGRSLVCLALLAPLLLTSARAAEKQVTGDQISTRDGVLMVQPINHATFVLGWKDKVICVDPVGGARRFTAVPAPDLILITDIHGDHLDVPTLTAIATDKTTLVAPQAVTEKLPEALGKRTTTLRNGERKSIGGIEIEAVPMYNITPERLKFHTKGRGNGYVLTLGGKRVYISGDTEDIPEMRALRNIDVAFVCMNLPYTMTVEQAASAVREFKPAIVYPYHSRGSDIEKFRQLVGQDSGTEVRNRDWYQ